MGSAHVGDGLPRSRRSTLILYGSKGLDAYLAADERYARDLATVGVDALLWWLG